MTNIAEALSAQSPEVPLPPELKGALETARRIASLDFTGVRDSTGKTVETKGCVFIDKVDQRFVLVGSGDSAKKVDLLTYIYVQLPPYVSKLPPEKVQEFKDKGLLTEQDGRLVFPYESLPTQKITLLAAVADQIKEEGLANYESLLKKQGLTTGDFLTGLQALAVSLAQSAYDQYQPPTTPEETKEITYAKKKAAAKDRFKISVAFGRDWEDEGLELAVEREMIFKVKRDEKAVDDQGKGVIFENLLNQVREAVRQGDFNQAITTRNSFLKTLENNPGSREKIIGRLKKIIAMRLSSKEMASSNDGPALHALLGKEGGVFDNQDFQEALRILFPFEKQLPGLNNQDQTLRRKAAGEYYRNFYELGAVIFGTEGLQKLVEVDLHTAVGLQDILLTPGARLTRIDLEEKVAQARQKMLEQTKAQDPRLQTVLERLDLTSSGFDQAVKDLEVERQNQRKAILSAFSVKFEDGTPAVKPEEITPEIQQLAEEIKKIYETLMASGQSGILEANRRMIQSMLHASLDREKIERLNQRLSEQGFGPKTEAILQELDINKDDSDYELVRRIITDGRRVAGSLIGLGRRVKDPYSQVEDLTITGDLFDMGLKGVEYLHRHGQFDEEPVTKTITLPGKPGEKPAVELPQQVPIYRIIQTEATGQAPTVAKPEVEKVTKREPLAYEEPIEYELLYECEIPIRPKTAEKLGKPLTIQILDANQRFVEERKTPQELIQKRIEAQETYIQRLKTQYSLDNPDPNTQRMLYRLNGQTKDYITELEEINSQLPPMSEKTKLTIIIPAYNEQGRIENTLRNWLNQKELTNGNPLNLDTTEILVIVNRPNATREFDQTAEIVKTLKKETEATGLNIFVVEKTFNFPDEDTTTTAADSSDIKVPKGVRMGLIYKYGADLAILRNLARKDSLRKANHLLRTGAADVYARSPYHLSRTFTWFDKYPYLEQYVSRADYPPAIYQKIPLLHVAERLNEMMNLQLTRGKSHVGLGTYRTGIYAQSNGFNPQIDVREEIDLSKRMREIMDEETGVNNSRKREIIINALDDPRRAIATIFAGKPTIYKYQDFANQAIRKMDLDKIIAAPLPAEAQLTQENLNKQTEAILRLYFKMLYNPSKEGDLKESYDTVIRYLRNSFFALGIDDYEIRYNGDINADDGKKATENAQKLSLQIGNIDGLQELIAQYPTRPREEWLNKLPTLTPEPTPPPTAEELAQVAQATEAEQVITLPQPDDEQKRALQKLHDQFEAAATRIKELNILGLEKAEEIVTKAQEAVEQMPKTPGLTPYALAHTEWLKGILAAVAVDAEGNPLPVEQRLKSMLDHFTKSLTHEIRTAGDAATFLVPLLGEKGKPIAEVSGSVSKALVKLTEENGEKYLVALFTRGFTSAADLLPDDASAKGLFHDIGTALAAIMGPEQLRNAVASTIAGSSPWQTIQKNIKAAIEKGELDTIAQEAVQEAAASLGFETVKPISAMSPEELTTALESGQATEGQITEEIIRLKNNRDIPAFLIKNPDDRERAQALEKSLREREQQAQATTVQDLPGFLKDYPRTQTRPAPSTPPPSASDGEPIADADGTRSQMTPPSKKPSIITRLRSRLQKKTGDTPTDSSLPPSGELFA